MGSPARCSKDTVWPWLLLRGPPLPFPGGEPCSPHQHPDRRPGAAGCRAAPTEPKGRTIRGWITPCRLQDICTLCSPVSVPSPVCSLLTCAPCADLCPCPHLYIPVRPVLTHVPALTCVPAITCVPCLHLCALCSPMCLPSPVFLPSPVPPVLTCVPALTCASCPHLCSCPHL